MNHFNSRMQTLMRYVFLAKRLIREDKSLRLFFKVVLGKISKNRKEKLGIQNQETKTWQPIQTSNHPKVYVDKSRVLVAVTAHIYYEEYVSKLYNALENFPFKYDLFITTSDQNIFKKIQETFDSSDVKTKVVLVPNRGRHFAPLLVEFSTELLKYDYALHVHSKKSLHAPNLGSTWANSLWRSVIEDSDLLLRVMDEFIYDSQIAIYYPYFGRLLPHWTFTWARTEQIAKHFLAELKVVAPSSPIAFPAGGMFWIRPKLFFDFLNRNYTYDEFPEELGQLDGTIQHALERIMGVLPSQKALKHLIHIPESNLLTTDISFIWDTYEFKTARSLLSKLEEYETISFDFFDTLYRRKHQFPDIAKLLTGKQLSKFSTIDAKNYVETRNQVELSMRLTEKRDITLREVCVRLSQIFNVDSDLLLELECSFELMEAAPRTDVVKIANELLGMGKKVLITSDTYYSAEFLENLSRQIGLNNGVRIYSSSDENARKDTGELWKKIISTPGFSGGSFIHVGDNFLPDGQVPGDLGLQTALLMSGEAKWRRYGMPELEINLDTMMNDPSVYHLSEVVSNFGDSPF
jgi:FMN phosphatase YigB (HAD superfamily)